MIPGDPAALEAAADDYDRAGNEFARLRDELVANARRTGAEWLGLAGQLAQDQMVRRSDRASIAAQVCHGSAKALREHAAQLWIAQRDYAAAAQRRQATLAELDAVEVDPVAVAAGQLTPAAEAVAAATADMQAAQGRAESANDAAAQRIGRLTGQLPAMLPGDDAGSGGGSSYDTTGGNYWDGVRKGWGDFVHGWISLGSGLYHHLAVWDDQFDDTWQNTWDTATTIVADPIESAKTVGSSFIQPVQDSLHSGGKDEAASRAFMGVVGAVIGSKGLSKLTKLDDIAQGPHTPPAPGGGLRRHDDAGGHTLDPDRAHVGASDQEILNRLNNKPNLPAVSSYYDRAAAERAVSQNIAGNAGRHPRLVRIGGA